MAVFTGVAIDTTVPSAVPAMRWPEAPVAMVKKFVAPLVPSPTSRVPESSVNASAFDDAVLVEVVSELVVKSTEARLLEAPAMLTKARVSARFTTRSVATAGRVTRGVTVLPLGYVPLKR